MPCISASTSATLRTYSPHLCSYRRSARSNTAKTRGRRAVCRHQTSHARISAPPRLREGEALQHDVHETRVAQVGESSACCAARAPLGLAEIFGNRGSSGTPKTRSCCQGREGGGFELSRNERAGRFDKMDSAGKQYARCREIHLVV